MSLAAVEAESLTWMTDLIWSLPNLERTEAAKSLSLFTQFYARTSSARTRSDAAWVVRSLK
jgi:hypothetical protein